jgi:hypothetical protein
VPVLDSGRAGSMTTFAQRGIGDVLLSWENEAYLTIEEFGAELRDRLSVELDPGRTFGGPGRQERRPPQDPHRGRGLSALPLQPAGPGPDRQEPLPPARGAAAAKYASKFKQLPLVTIDGQFGGWAKAQAKHFADGGVFDQIYKPGCLTLFHDPFLTRATSP